MDKLNHQINIIANNFNWFKHVLPVIPENKQFFLGDLPLIDQNILEKYYYNNDFNLDNPLIYHTSGTSSKQRKQILYSQDDHDQYLNHRRQIFMRYITDDCKKACADLGTGHAADSASIIFKNLGLESIKISYEWPIEKHIEILNKYQPDVLFTMPMILQKLLNTGDLKIKLKKIFLVGDVVTPAWLEHIAEYFFIKTHDIVDLLGSIEVGSIAFFNHHIGFYQFEEHIIPEVIPYQSTNQSSILILTSMARTYFPAIRFNTNDIIKNFHSMHYQGQNIFVFEHCLGRIGNEFKIGEKISYFDILNCIEQYLPNIPFNINENGYSIEILIPENKINDICESELQKSLRMINPDVKNMITSGLVDDFKITRVPEQMLETNHFKRRISHKL